MFMNGTYGTILTVYVAMSVPRLSVQIESTHRDHIPSFVYWATVESSQILESDFVYYANRKGTKTKVLFLFNYDKRV